MRELAFGTDPEFEVPLGYHVAAFEAVDRAEDRARRAVRDAVTNLMRIGAVADFFVGRDLRDDFVLPDYGFRSASPPS